MATKQTAPSEPLAALSAHIADVERQAVDLLAEQIRLERAGIVPSEPKPGESQQSRVRKYLNGFAGALGLVEGQSEGNRLYEVIQSRAAAKLALSDLERQRQKLSNEADAIAAEKLAPIFRQWIHAYVIAADQLRGIEAQIQNVPWSIRNRLPLAHHFGRSPLGVAWGSDPVSRLRTEALAEGIISRSDVKDTANVQ